MSEPFAARLRRVREAAGMTQQDVSRRLRVSLSCYRSWERLDGDTRHFPELENRRKLLRLWPYLLSGEIPVREIPPEEKLFLRS